MFPGKQRLWNRVRENKEFQALPGSKTREPVRWGMRLFFDCDHKTDTQTFKQTVKVESSWKERMGHRPAGAILV